MRAADTLCCLLACGVVSAKRENKKKQSRKATDR
jgi:hypothetical protein